MPVRTTCQRDRGRESIRHFIGHGKIGESAGCGRNFESVPHVPIPLFCGQVKETTKHEGIIVPCSPFLFFLAGEEDDSRVPLPFDPIAISSFSTRVGHKSYFSHR